MTLYNLRSRNKAYLFLLVIFYPFLVPFLIEAKSFTGKVVGVSDGDTIKVMHNGKVEKVRLNGIDCPEKKQPFGNQAKQFTSALAFGKFVKVEVFDMDQYGRIIGEVFLPDGSSLNRKLVKGGLAWWYRSYSNDENLKKLEREARSDKKGLWKDPKPVPPWEWRKNKSIKR